MGGLWYGSPVEFTDYMIWKLIAFAVAAFVWNFWRGFTGRFPDQRAQRGKQAEAPPGQASEAER